MRVSYQWSVSSGLVNYLVLFTPRRHTIQSYLKLQPLSYWPTSMMKILAMTTVASSRQCIDGLQIKMSAFSSLHCRYLHSILMYLVQIRVADTPRLHADTDTCDATQPYSSPQRPIRTYFHQMPFLDLLSMSSSRGSWSCSTWLFSLPGLLIHWIVDCLSLVIRHSSQFSTMHWYMDTVLNGAYCQNSLSIPLVNILTPLLTNNGKHIDVYELILQLILTESVTVFYF